MKLSSISFRNVKGCSGTLDLKSINFLVGANARGKSARTDAIRLLLIGHLPELGKLARATFSLCSGREMLVEGMLDSGFVIRRRWWLEGDKVKTESVFPVGIPEDLLLVMLNAETYFGLSERDRVAYVAANIPGIGGELTPTSIFSGVREHLAGVDGTTVKSISDLMTKLNEAEETETKKESFLEWTAQSFVDFLLERSEEAERVAKNFGIQMERTVQGLAYLRAAEKLEADLPAIESRKLVLAVEIDADRERKAALSAKSEAALNARTRRRTIEVELTSKASFEKMLPGAVSKLGDLSAKLSEHRVVEHSEIDSLRAELQAAQSARTTARSDLDHVSQSLTVNNLELAAIEAAKVCPCCGADGEGWKEKKTAELTSTLAGLKTKSDQLREHVADLGAHCDRLLSRHNRAIDAQRARVEAERRVASAREEHAGLEKQIASYAGKEAELAALPVVDPVVDKELAEVINAITLKLNECEELDRKRRAFEGRAHDLKRLAEAEKQRDEGRVDQLAAKSAAAHLREVKAKMVAEAFDPLLSIANGFFFSLLKTPIAYHEGEIGTWREGTWVSHKTFSGTEKALVYAAIQAALASKSPIRMMLIDELGRLDDANSTSLDVALYAAIKSGAIEQFVGIDTMDRHAIDVESGQTVAIV